MFKLPAAYEQAGDRFCEENSATARQAAATEGSCSKIDTLELEHHHI
jgi:hypothetical protein